MSRRTTIALIMLALLLLSLVVVAVTRPPEIEVRRTEEPSDEFTFDPDERLSPLDDGVPPLTEAGEGSQTEQPKAVVRVTSHSGWINNEIYEVFGEVENQGILTARGVSFHVIFKDGLFNTLEEVDGPADQTTLEPGDTSTFKIKLNDKEKSEVVGSYIVIPQIDL